MILSVFDGVLYTPDCTGWLLQQSLGSPFWGVWGTWGGAPGWFTDEGAWDSSSGPALGKPFFLSAEFSAIPDFTVGSFLAPFPT